MISSIIQALFLIKIQSNMSEQDKKWQRIYDLLHAKILTLLITWYGTIYWTKQMQLPI